ncbi:MAG: adenosylmethionine decarboxylase [Pseudomonadota bacterium]|nr:adenosylmethionine decarboxylase [Pseudomonadota bacterium]
MNALGNHLLVELYECDAALLDDLDGITDAMVEAALEAGATVIDRTFHRFAPQGVSGVVVIAESHLAIHTWPEHRYAAVDVFTCGTRVSPDRCADILCERLGSKRQRRIHVPRGPAEDVRGPVGEPRPA